MGHENVEAMKICDRICDRCDEPGGKKTYKNQVLMPLYGRVECIDYCIHKIIAALNAGGVRTVASCCGHQKMPGCIDLEDGRVLIITDNPDELVWPTLINLYGRQESSTGIH